MTGLTLQDFDLLVSLGVFNRELMNDAVYKFKRYEDASLVYTGINTHEGENVGGFDTVISEQTYKNQMPQLEITSKSSTSEMREEKEVLLDEEENASMEEEDKAPWFSYTAGDRVTHKSFGEGVITSIEDQHIMIQFATSEKKFLSPKCFAKGSTS